MTFAALQTNYCKCGGPGKRRNPTGKKLGRPRVYTRIAGINPGINVNDEVHSYFHVGATHYFARKCSMQKALDHIIDIYFSKEFTDDQGRVRIHIDENAKPTLTQFRYFVNTTYPFAERYRKRNGQKRWNLEGRGLVGRADGDIQGPGDRYFIDATVGDVYLRSQLDRQRIVGRPVIYFVIDTFSRLIVGIYVGFEGPSWIGAMMALVNVVTPKVSFCRQYGIDIEEMDRPSHYLPKILQADCGELKNTRLGHNIVHGLHVEIDNVGPWRPDLQALVERRFGSVPATFKEFVPGYIRSDFKERGAEDYRFTSKLNLYEYTGNVIRAVIEHNYHPIGGKLPPAEMITEGMTACPIDLWNWGIINRSEALPTASVDEVALNVMYPDKAKVTSKGIEFNGDFYSCPTALREEWFSIARKQEWHEAISYDPRDLGTFYLRNSKLPNGYEVCSLLDPNSSRAGKTLVEVQELDHAYKDNLAATENERQSRRIQSRREMRAVEKRAIAEAKAIGSPEGTKTARLASIRENRSQEREAQRARERFNLAQSNAVDKVTVSSDLGGSGSPTNSMTSDLLAILRQHRQDRGRDGDG
ncbi:DDE-type integrase/transposase/recombinase [Microvirga tunisiensis]|uniref:Transposase family protein n=1 Tax=Microvirga tunisiensis TaxID=2108360 RepID=A0A5N7MVT2_9HYPH|nr:DDE-type integrase/transposase/recombinase [Microvirga tunisiensis]MPR13198.1 transposase family protein [Microvirga tunisiensis]MPR31077.1 transposase family protein [Microvirga tunisiensis]